jgi:hypothetical protein
MLRFSTTTRLTALLVSGLSLGLFLFACSSTTVGTGPGDTGDDDDTADSGGDDGGSTGSDAGHVTVHDAGTDGSVVTDGGGGSDGGPVIGTDGGSDGGACEPTEPVGSNDTYYPPVDGGAVCTGTEISDYVNSCGAGSIDTDCDNFHQTAPAACLACLETDVTSSNAWGAVLTDRLSHIITINSAGCIATLDPSSLSCAESIEDVLQCESAACDVPCENTDYDAQRACENAAD